MTEAKRPLKVFLCHAHADRDAVKALYTRLTQDGVDAWLDKEKLLPGQDWELEIRKAVREADVVVVCLSKQFNQAGFRQKEVRLALDTAMEQPEGEIFIIPARLDECDALESLRKWHWVDLFEENGYEMLMRALSARADRIDAILQIKKSWFSNNSSSYQFQQKPISTSQNEPEAENDKPKIDGINPKQRLTVRKLFSKTVLAFWGIFVLIAVVLTVWLPSLRKPFSETPTLQNTPVSKSTDIPSIVTSNDVTVTITPLPIEITNTKSLGKIAFTSDNCVGDLCKNIYIMNADGSEQKNLTLNSPAPYNYNPEFSPDGTNLLFMGGYHYGSDVLFMIDLKSFEITLIKELPGTTRGNSGLSWSLDGENVIYDIYIDNDVRNIVESFNFITQVTVRLTNNNEDDDSPSWSFDGSKIVFLSGFKGQNDLFLMNPDGTNRQLLLTDRGCLNPRFSPVNLKIVMSCLRYGSDLFIFDLTTKELTPITNFPSAERSPSWSPDGEWIVFESNMDDPNYQTCSPKDGDTPCNNEIYIVRSDGSNLTRLTFNKDDDGDPVWGR